MDWKLEVVVILYEEQCGFNVDVDRVMGDDFRVVQLTPPGSACSVTIGKGLSQSTPGCLQGLQLVVSDIDAARAQLVARGVEASPVMRFEDGKQVEGHGGDWNSFVFFSDPDGNGWAIQQKPAA